MASWPGLTPGNPYVGYIGYVDGSGTLVQIT
jgi:hypothetical protein